MDPPDRGGGGALPRIVPVAAGLCTLHRGHALALSRWPGIRRFHFPGPQPPGAALLRLVLRHRLCLPPLSRIDAGSRPPRALVRRAGVPALSTVALREPPRI